MDQLPPEIARLSVAERLQLIHLLWESMPDEALLTKAQQEDLHRRIAEFEADPDEGQDWEDVKAELERESR